MQLPKLGVGVVYIPGLEPLLEPGNTCVDVIEIEPETLWHHKDNISERYVFPEHTLKQLNRFPQPKIIHSVGFAVGGSYCPPQEYIQALSKAIDVLKAPWASEHLSFTHVQTADNLFHTGFMLPSLQTKEGALTAANTIRKISSQLTVPFAVETAVNYLKPRQGELSDGEFVALAVEKADCGILLDIHNIWTNEINGRQKVKEFLAQIPLERVWEIHLGGGFMFDGYWLDAHSGEVPEAVLEITEELVSSLPNLSAITYEIFPSYIPLFGLSGIEKQLCRIKNIWNHYNSQKVSSDINSSYKSNLLIEKTDTHDEISPHIWEHTLGQLVTYNDTERSYLAEELKKDNSIELIRKLIWKFRAGAIVKALPTLTKLIIMYAGDKELEDLVDGYIKSSKPEPFASEEAKGFIRYLRQKDTVIPYLHDILAYEEGVMEVLLDQKTQHVLFHNDPIKLFQTLIHGDTSNTTIQEGVFELEISPESLGMR